MTKPSQDDLQQISYAFAKSVTEKFGDRGDTWGTNLYLSVLNALNNYFSDEETKDETK